MFKDFLAESSIISRKSVRAYSEKKIDTMTKEKITTYFEKLDNPFMIDIDIKLLERKGSLENESLGTYGFIKGADYFIGACARNQDMALEGLGYSLEKMVLYLTSLGISTCWLGGSFNRSSFSKAMNLQKGLLFPCVISLGYPINKTSIINSITKALVSSHKKLRWDQLFFKDNFSTPLAQNDLKDYAIILEMVRKAPSTSNAQPWRVVLKDGIFHFFKHNSIPVSNIIGGVDLQKVDMGIAACHFDIMAQEKGKKGNFAIINDINIEIPSGIEYSYSWIPADNNYLKTS